MFLLLLLAFMWRMGWIGDKELRGKHFFLYLDNSYHNCGSIHLTHVLLEYVETKVKIGERTFTLKQIIHATKKFSPKMKLGSGRSGIVYRVKKEFTCSLIFAFGRITFMLFNLSSF